MDKTVNVKLILSAIWVTQNWFQCREQIGRLCQIEWKNKNISDFMWSNYIMVDIPITMQLCRLERVNQAILFRALEANELYSEDEFVNY